MVVVVVVVVVVAVNAGVLLHGQGVTGWCRLGLADGDRIMGVYGSVVNTVNR